MWERAGGFCALPRLATLPAPHCVHQPENSLNPVLLSFYGDFITQSSLIKSPAIGNQVNLQPLSLPWGWEQNPYPLITWSCLLATSLYPLGASKNHFTHIT